MMTWFRPRNASAKRFIATPQDRLPAPPPVEARQQNSAGWHSTGRATPSPLRAKRAAPQVHRCPTRHGRPENPNAVRAFEAWTDFAVPVSVSPPTVSALPRVFAAIAVFALDAAARLAVFWPHLPVAARVLRVPDPAAAGLSAGPAPALHGADPALAGASCPTRHSGRVE